MKTNTILGILFGALVLGALALVLASSTADAFTISWGATQCQGNQYPAGYTPDVHGQYMDCVASAMHCGKNQASAENWCTTYSPGGKGSNYHLFLFNN